MKGKRCQVCDGPVVNGRCKFCGMPYRNDEVLYHLNESRSDHYRHASKKAQETMRRQQIPLGDRKPEPKRMEGKTTQTREEIRARQQQERNAAVERMTNSRVQTTHKGTVQNKQNSQSVFKNVDIRGQRKTYTSPPVEKKKKKSSLLGVIVTLVIALVGIVPEFVEYIEDKIDIMPGSSVNTQVSSEVFSRWQDESDIIYEIAPDYGVITIGEDMESGDYIAYVAAGSADFYVTSGQEVYSCHLEDEEDVEYLSLKDGDWIEITRTDGIYGTVCFYTQAE